MATKIPFDSFVNIARDAIENKPYGKAQNETLETETPKIVMSESLREEALTESQ